MRAGFVLHPELLHKEGAGHTVTGMGKHLDAKEYHTANQIARKCRKKKYDSIHDRFIRDKTFRKTMIELGTL